MSILGIIIACVFYVITKIQDNQASPFYYCVVLAVLWCIFLPLLIPVYYFGCVLTAIVSIIGVVLIDRIWGISRET